MTALQRQPPVHQCRCVQPQRSSQAMALHSDCCCAGAAAAAAAGCSGFQKQGPASCLGNTPAGHEVGQSSKPELARLTARIQPPDCQNPAAQTRTAATLMLRSVLQHGLAE
jgi:hypothetical protein